MTVEYELTGEDLRAFNLYHQAHSPTARRQYLFSWFFPAAVWLLVCTGIWYLADQKRGVPLQTFLDLLPLFCGVPVYLIYFPWAHRRNLRKIIDGMIHEGKNRRLFCRHRVSISPEVVAESGDFGESSTRWPAVERVVANREYAFLYLNALAAIVVPRRAFPTEQAFEEFVKTATGYREKALS